MHQHGILFDASFALAAHTPVVVALSVFAGLCAIPWRLRDVEALFRAGRAAATLAEFAVADGHRGLPSRADLGDIWSPPTHSPPCAT